MVRFLWLVFFIISFRATANVVPLAGRPMSPEEQESAKKFVKATYGRDVMTFEGYVIRDKQGEGWKFRSFGIVSPFWYDVELCKAKEFAINGVLEDGRVKWEAERGERGGLIPSNYQVWLREGSKCKEPTNPVHLSYPIPDYIVTDLLRKAGRILDEGCETRSVKSCGQRARYKLERIDLTMIDGRLLLELGYGAGNGREMSLELDSRDGLLVPGKIFEVLP